MVDLIIVTRNLARTKSRNEAEIAFVTNKNENEHANFTSKDELRFVIDNGATNHLVIKVGNFIINETPVNCDISKAKSGHCSKALKQGDFKLLTQTENPIKMKDVWTTKRRYEDEKNQNEDGADNQREMGKIVTKIKMEKKTEKSKKEQQEELQEKRQKTDKILKRF
ncbi:hypothetical protein ILUMI_18396 [Ignelater luminosus]|uniref:Uncharacterized protein n=1 Tax=Ignelater luminosus TaxID=2038154 RepID=A0A8K0CM65_IGNLU|nr:hypothetical protein ILUMI_18396 [Ignelater luminosus]